MRVAALIFVLLAAGLGPAAAADPAERSSSRRVEERIRVSPAAARHYGPQVALHGEAEQVVVTRGPRLLLESDDFGLLEPVYVTRRLPSTVTRARVEAEVPLYESARDEKAAPVRRGTAGR